MASILVCGLLTLAAVQARNLHDLLQRRPITRQAAVCMMRTGDLMIPVQVGDTEDHESEISKLESINKILQKATY